MRVLNLRKTKIKEMSIPENPRLERILILSLIALIIILSISYMYFVKQTIDNVVLRQNTEDKMSNLSSEISDMEVRYIELKNKIDLDFAYSLGYKEAQNIKFVSRKGLAKSLTLEEN